MKAPPSDARRVSRLLAGDAAPAGALLGRAFADDPLMAYYFEGAPDRANAVLATMTAATRLTLRYGTGFRLDVDGRLAGVALLLPPSLPDFPPGAVALAVLRTRSLWRPRALRRHFGVAASFAAHRPPFPSWLLLSIGIEPARQHRGHGAWLLEQVLESLPSGSPICLETLNERNLPLYRRHGFEITGDFLTHEGRGPRAWSMLRTAPDDADGARLPAA